jgi:methionine-rich copper-binding protein CopC
MSRHPRPRRLRAALPFIVVLVVLAVPAAVAAHAELETVSPADGTTVTVAPSEIVMTFSEALDPAKSSIVLAEVGGSPLLSGGVVDPADATRMTLATPDLAAGEYEIRWTSASAEDGDIDRGTTHFTYAPPPPSPSATASTAPSVAPSPSVASSPSAAPSPSPSAAGTPAASSTDILLPIVAALAVVVLLGTWLLRNRARGAGR